MSKVENIQKYHITYFSGDKPNQLKINKNYIEGKDKKDVKKKLYSLFPNVSQIVQFRLCRTMFDVNIGLFY